MLSEQKPLTDMYFIQPFHQHNAPCNYHIRAITMVFEALQSSSGCNAAKMQGITRESCPCGDHSHWLNPRQQPCDISESEVGPAS